jgi:succinate dehydrogenase / fumarate reductase, cytochrome b subunit
MTTPEPTSAPERPLSPHLTIYKPQITSVMSILHRITGVALSGGTFLLVAWLWAAAYSPACFESIHAFFGSIFGKLLLFGWTLAFYYHLLNGIRHLCWDMGKGFDMQTVERSGVVIGVASGALTMISWIIAFSIRIATP